MGCTASVEGKHEMEFSGLNNELSVSPPLKLKIKRNKKKKKKKQKDGTSKTDNLSSQVAAEEQSPESSRTSTSTKSSKQKAADTASRSSSSATDTPRSKSHQHKKKKRRILDSDKITRVERWMNLIPFNDLIDPQKYVHEDIQEEILDGSAIELISLSLTPREEQEELDSVVPIMQVSRNTGQSTQVGGDPSEDYTKGPIILN